MTESTTPRTTVRCAMCNRLLEIGGCPQIGDGTDESVIACWQIAISRLKAENASLRANVDQLVGDVQAITQDYTNAAGALRWIADWDKQPAMMQVARTLHYDMAAKARAALSGEEAAGPAEPPSEVVPEPLPTRASLLESLRAAEEKRLYWTGEAAEYARKHAAAEQRAEAAEKRHADVVAMLSRVSNDALAAEKRSTDLMGARDQARRLFWLYGQHSATCRQSPGGNGPCTCAFQEAWAALHDEERPAECPEEGCTLDADHDGTCDTDIPEVGADEERSARPPEAEPLEPKFENTHAETFEDARREFGHSLCTPADEERSAPPRPGTKEEA